TTSDAISCVFFSSRRRHTRSKRDWSSDVCSSDLSDDYSVELKQGITTGYSEDFESEPAGWTSYGDGNSWEWGEPTSGPESALTGDHVYATNLSGEYDGDMNASLEMPPIDLPEGESFLQFTHWHEFEKYDSGNAYDFGHVLVSTD